MPMTLLTGDPTLEKTACPPAMGVTSGTPLMSTPRKFARHGQCGQWVSDLYPEIAKIVARPEVRDEWAKQGAVPMSMSPDEFAKYTVADIAKWERIVKISGAKADQ